MSWIQAKNLFTHALSPRERARRAIIQAFRGGITQLVATRRWPRATLAHIPSNEDSSQAHKAYFATQQQPLSSTMQTAATSIPHTTTTTTADLDADEQAHRAATEALHVQATQAAQRITVAGLALNVTLSTGKIVVGTLAHSAAMIADAAHSFTDLVSDFTTLAAVRYSRRPPSAAFPFGLGKLETVASLFVSGMLMVTGGGLIAHSLDIIANPAPPASALLTQLALGTAVVSIISKELIYRVTVRLGNTLSSPALIANAWHHRIDAYSSVVALVGIGGQALSVPILDPLAGMLVAAMIFRTGLSIGKDNMKELLDGSLSPEVLAHLSSAVDTAAGSVAGSASHLRGRHAGPFIVADVRLLLPAHTDLAAAQQRAHTFRNEVIERVPHLRELLMALSQHIRGADLSKLHAFVDCAGQSNHDQASRYILYSKLTDGRSEHAVDDGASWTLCMTDGFQVWTVDMTLADAQEHRDLFQVSFERYFQHIRTSMLTSQVKGTVSPGRDTIQLQLPPLGSTPREVGNAMTEPVVLQLNAVDEGRGQVHLADMLMGIAQRCNDAVRRADRADADLARARAGEGSGGGRHGGRYHRHTRPASEAFRDDDDDMLQAKSARDSAASASGMVAPPKRKPGFSLINPSVQRRTARGVKFGASGDDGADE
ncbi:hypothetical protein CAOG_08523 [Capsaspora owczarzaki ATCC 30864]|uniref:Cation efflux protein transmembrane domain-containing protein n=1 Tax=Capsaspora owczarzaki (strain ATCC 30864) TaxID=595528 RepID=A0A0D2WJI6_CAPO3|nr:hypothetical protein CAOG_08523 [Capsaspora owczarzaki ATCC 30864]KJE90225.1 hypothetical protein CAOG_008523 [Capsaspora owczarzaki ATCC 30864]|eukprot:XP_011270104.1 hypothetical protein CAOG_08523 [Capsaspora owczarzaki ATCC 30864]